MRSDLPPAVAAALARCARPSLVFDAARLDANARAIAGAARACGITALFAAKSFPHAEVRAICARHFDGFDVASPGELAEVPAARVISVVDPAGWSESTPLHLRPAGHPVDGARCERLIVGCETVAQAAAAPARAEIAIRISASITGRDPAIGAVQDGSGHRRSRFGVDDAAAVGELARAAGGRPLGLHVHHGPVSATSAERFLASAHAALALADAAGVRPRFLDVGGAWHAVPDVGAALRELRAAVPADIELVIEPGRAVAEGAGFACGRVVAARTLADRELRVVELSRICHLRWSHVELVGAPPRPGTGVATIVVGPTCFEEDVVGEWVVDPALLVVGARAVVRHVTGYAVAWNTGFGGVAPADVILV